MQARNKLRAVLWVLGWWVSSHGLAIAENGRPVPGPSRPPAIESVPSPAGRDPYEAFNRQVFAFNAWLVRDLVEPLAGWLGETLPLPIQQAGKNMYNNLVEPEFIVTNLFAGDQEGAKISGQRFLINSTLGLAGVWDAAGWLGYQRREVEFIESLCAAGWNPGEFIVLPAVGPANAQAAALVTGFFALEWYVLSYISTTLATADLVVDLSASAASLRYARHVPGQHLADPYQAQREEFLRYLDAHCPQRHQG